MPDVTLSVPFPLSLRRKCVACMDFLEEFNCIGLGAGTTYHHRIRVLDPTSTHKRVSLIYSMSMMRSHRNRGEESRPVVSLRNVSWHGRMYCQEESKREKECWDGGICGQESGGIQCTSREKCCVIVNASNRTERDERTPLHKQDSLLQRLKWAASRLQ